jgi:hypothetical protein
MHPEASSIKMPAAIPIQPLSFFSPVSPLQTGVGQDPVFLRGCWEHPSWPLFDKNYQTMTLGMISENANRFRFR